MNPRERLKTAIISQNYFKPFENKLIQSGYFVKNFNYLQNNDEDYYHQPEILRDDADNEAPIIKLVNKILILKIRKNIEQIYIQPQKDKLIIRGRKEGMMTQYFSFPI